MATVGVFLNLPELNDNETVLRKSTFGSTLVGHQLKYAYGAGQYDQYAQKAAQLANTDPLPDIFQATCWPSVEALRRQTQNTGKGIVFAGLTEVPGEDYSKGSYYYDPRVTGIIAFAVENLCRNWLDLL